MRPQTGPKMAPKTAQEAPKTAQEAPKTAQDAFKTAQEAPKTAQEAPKTAPKGPEDGPQKRLPDIDPGSGIALWNRHQCLLCGRFPGYAEPGRQGARLRELKMRRRGETGSLLGPFRGAEMWWPGESGRRPPPPGEQLSVLSVVWSRRMLES